MTDNIRLLTKDYFNQHPVKKLSAAQIAYSMLLHPEIVDLAEKYMPKLQAEGLNVPDYSGEIAEVEREEDTDRLLRIFRKSLPIPAKKILIEKLLAREAEVLPEIQRIILRTFNTAAIENTTRFMVKCQANCSEWIMAHYSEVRQPYARSMLCLVLGFRADDGAIPFLMHAVDVFERQYPDKTFDQAPLIALSEIQARFLEG